MASPAAKTTHVATRKGVAEKYLTPMTSTMRTGRMRTTIAVLRPSTVAQRSFRRTPPAL